MSRVTAIISALVICIIVCLSWAVNHYRDNAITYKAQRDKNARELKLANAAITDMQMRQRDVAALDAKYTKELALTKLKMMLCVMMLPLVVVGCTSKRSVSRCVGNTTASGVDNAASPRLADAAERGINLRERLITMQKQLEGTKEYINEQCRQSCPYRWATHAIIVSNTHALPANYKCPKVIKPRAIHLRMFAGFLFLSSSAPPQILAASTVFLLPIQKRRNDGRWFYRCYCCGLF